MSDKTVSVTGLFLYPVKSCAGIAIERGYIGRYGMKNDRRWMIVTSEGRYISQREEHRLALIRPSIGDHDELSLDAPGMLPITISSTATREPAVREVTVHRDRCLAADEGDEAAAWLSEFLRMGCRLVRAAEGFDRHASRRSGSRPIDISFTDAYPFLLIGEESLEELCSRLEAPVPMNRFRPNIVVRGAGPYAEDGWLKLRIGSMEFTAIKGCARCVITTVDQLTAVAGKEPLQTLARYRKTDEGAMFGQYLAHESQGTIALADAVTILA